MTPFPPDIDDGLLSTYFRDLLADSDDEYRPFPEPHGVLPFAISGELKYMFCWLTSAAAERWPVLVQTDGGWRRYRDTATEVLLRAFRRELFGDPPDDVPPQGTFTSSTPRTPKPPSAPSV